MSIKKDTSNDGKTVFLNITGRFDYKIAREFRNSYNDAKGQAGTTYFINLRDVSHIDSSALGILLLLREHAKNTKGRVILNHPSEQARQILKVAQFEKLFTINDTNTKPDYLKLVQ